jgi:hypothetical protein
MIISEVQFIQVGYREVIPPLETVTAAATVASVINPLRTVALNSQNSNVTSNADGRKVSAQQFDLLNECLLSRV